MLQSVARQVGLDLSNMRTPSLISWMTTCSNSSSRVSVQTKGVPGFIRCLKSCRWLATEKAYATWFKSPNHDRISVILDGRGNWRIASRLSWHGRTFSVVTSNPANFTVSFAKANFLGFSVTPFEAQASIHSTAWKNACSMSESQIHESSTHCTSLGMSATRALNRLVYASPVTA